MSETFMNVSDDQEESKDFDENALEKRNQELSLAERASRKDTQRTTIRPSRPASSSCSSLRAAIIRSLLSRQTEGRGN
ncbi:hypothetical protein CEXT_216001 [Caerostris extrusa]|uniref:Uncharacterized protein n=1 Tax=Caerostris extrusa TaxID=172846 RepID=A0AAV4SYJ8_CAEEX|nr:hypothetical protein CEXT_216001 [Caerostris extrusa]